MAKSKSERKKHSVSVEHEILHEAKKAGGYETFVDTVHAGLRLLAQASTAAAPPPPLAAALPPPAAARASLGVAPATNFKSASEMSDAEYERTDEALRSKRRGLNDAIALLKSQKQLDPTKAGRIEAIIADLEVRVDNVSQQLNLLDAGDLTMAPPTSATVARISELADTVSGMTAEAGKTDAIIATAVQLGSSLTA